MSCRFVFVTISFWGCRHSQQYFVSNVFYFLISFYLYPLHVSAPMGHPQVEYTTSQSLEVIMPTADRFFLLSYAIIIHIFVFVF
jgi:hypothetical protein